MLADLSDILDELTGEKKVFEPEKPVKEIFALINSETVVQGLIKDRADLIEMQWKEKS